jgi:capsule polysaccharide export protein KpsC/LpsZ
VYFPLQVPNDAAITVRAPKFYRQDLIADIISRALPSGHFLYVKEHPNEKGAIPLYWIKRISSIPNVKLVPVNTSSHYLIKNSRAVIVITSETGWEGLLYLKPVIVLGNPFYSKLGITFDVEKIEDLPKIIKKALRTEKVDKHRVYKVIYALIKSSCDCTSSLISLGNKDISKIVDFVIKEYDYRTMKMR